MNIQLLLSIKQTIIRYGFSALAFSKALSWRQPRRSNQRRSTKEHTRKRRTKNNQSTTDLQCYFNTQAIQRAATGRRERRERSRARIPLYMRVLTDTDRPIQSAYRTSIDVKMEWTIPIQEILWKHALTTRIYHNWSYSRYLTKYVPLGSSQKR